MPTEFWDYRCPQIPARRGGIHAYLPVYNRVTKWKIEPDWLDPPHWRRYSVNVFGHYYSDFCTASPCRWPRLSHAIRRIRFERQGHMTLFGKNKHYKPRHKLIGLGVPVNHHKHAKQ